MKILLEEKYILYETYDCILQYVQFTANSHNFQTNINFNLMILIMSYIEYIMPYIILYFVQYLVVFSTTNSFFFLKGICGLVVYYSPIGLMFFLSKRFR